MNSLKFTFLILILTSFFSCEQTEDPGYERLTLYQLRAEMMSYVIITPGEKIIIIDGGKEKDAPELYSFLKINNYMHVDHWIITHPHKDHVGALTAMLFSEDMKDISIGKIYCSLLNIEDIELHEPESVVTVQRFLDALDHSSMTITEPKIGDEIIEDSVTVRILGVKNPDITTNFLNNSSIALKVHDRSKSILFTGDLGVEGGNKLLAANTDLSAQYVQMSHHGSNGVSKEFYEAVRPEYCLWPTTGYIWINDGGRGPNTGRHTTLIVREWMKELGVKKNYLMFRGSVRIK